MAVTGCNRSESSFKRINHILEKITNDNNENRILENLRLGESKAFYERLSTFNSFSWSLKPACISPPLCAKFGWKLLKPHILQCTNCRKILNAELPPAWQLTYYNQRVLHLEKAIKDSHEKYCPWPFKNCTENYLHDMLLKREESVDDFKKRFLTFLNCKRDLPKIAMDLPDELKLCCQNLQSSKLLIEITTDKDGCTLDATYLTLTGWSIDFYSNGQPRIKCSQCLRSLDPAYYRKQSDSENFETSAETEEPVVKQSRKHLPTLFHPLNEHHKWCPWITIISGKELGTNAGKQCWMVLYNSLSSHHLLPQETPRNVVLRVMGIMNKWIK